MVFTATSDAMSSLLPLWEQQLEAWAASGQLTSAAEDALLLASSPATLSDLVSQWSAGDFSSLPPIQLLSGSDIGGALGAYASSTGTIYSSIMMINDFCSL